jgi:hypothetical protein
MAGKQLLGYISGAVAEERVLRLESLVAEHRL